MKHPPRGWKAAEPPGDPWPEPMDLFDVIAPGPKLTREMLPDSPAIEYAFDVAERMGVHPTVTVPAMLAACAAAIDDRFQVQRKIMDGEHLERAHANFWLVAESGAGKTPAITAMLRPLKDAEDRWAKEYGVALSDYELRLRVYKDQETAYREQLKKAPPHDPIPDPPVPPGKPVWRKVIIEEATTEGVVRALEGNPRGVLSHQDEIAGFLGSFDAYRNGSTGKDRGFWLQTDNGGPYTVDRVGGRIRVPNLSVSFIGGVQPDRLPDGAPLDQRRLRTAGVSHPHATGAVPGS